MLWELGSPNSRRIVLPSAQTLEKSKEVKRKIIVFLFILPSFIKIAPADPVFVDGDERCVCWKQKKTDQMTTGFGFTVFVIPNLVRDLGLGFKAPPCGRGSLFEKCNL